MKKYFYITGVVIFIFLNCLKISFIDNFIVNLDFKILADKAVFYKFILYFLIGLIVFIWLMRKRNRGFVILFYLLQSVYLFIHFACFLYFKDIYHIGQAVFQFREGIALLRHFAIPQDPRYSFILLDMPLFIFIMFNFSKINGFLRDSYKIINLRRLFFIFCLLAVFPFFYKSNSALAYINVGDSRSEKEVIRKYGLFVNDIREIFFFKYQDVVMDSIDYGKPIVVKNHTKSQSNNIICIQVEGMDADIINAEYKDMYVMPFMHKLSSECIYYPYMISSCSSGATSDAEISVLNSMIPSEKVLFYSFSRYIYPNSFVKRLSSAGFETMAFHNNTGGFFNRAKNFEKMGFHDFYDINKMKLKEYSWGASDGDVFDFVENRLKHQKMPFMYYIITMSSHEPFNYVRTYYTNKDYEDIKEEIVRNYFNSMSYVDSVLKNIVLFLKNNVDNTYIIIYGDHHCSLIKDSVVFKKTTYDNMVPLFIVTPDNKHYVENSKIASMLDLAPTILYASGIDFEIMTKGVNLLDYPISAKSLFFRNNLVLDRGYLFKDK